MLSHPGAGIVSHPARRDRISFAYPQPPCVPLFSSARAQALDFNVFQRTGPEKLRVSPGTWADRSGMTSEATVYKLAGLQLEFVDAPR